MIALVVPTIRKECIEVFKDSWKDLIDKYNIDLVTVTDGKDPDANGRSVKEIMGKDGDLIYNFNDGVRNLGFAYVAKYLKHVDYIITLDDDTKPLGDTVNDHLTALNMKVPTSWMSTATEYMRGFPYKIREESEVVLSHGIWQGVADWDAPTQLVCGNRHVGFYQGPIPKGIYYPMCGMNVAFKSKMLPYMYYAPMGHRVGMDRFADIWLGITSKRVIDENGWAVISGYAGVIHDRASNVWKNLQKEAKGLELNETFWEGDESNEYFKLYKKQRERWNKYICSLL